MESIQGIEGSERYVPRIQFYHYLLCLVCKCRCQSNILFPHGRQKSSQLDVTLLPATPLNFVSEIHEPPLNTIPSSPSPAHF